MSPEENPPEYYATARDGERAAVEELRRAIRDAREAQGYEIPAWAIDEIDKAIAELERCIGLLTPDDP